jgi:hypothetical protein
MNRLNNIEMLIMLSEDVRAQGDDLSSEMFQRGREQAMKLSQMKKMLEEALTAVDRELHRFGQYLPLPSEKRAELPRAASFEKTSGLQQGENIASDLPRAVTKGPRPMTG